MTVPALNFVNRVIFSATSGGTSAFTPGSAAVGFQLMGVAGALVGAQYGYTAQSGDLSQWEVGYGTWNGTTLTRTVLFNSLGTTALINFSIAPQVMISALAEVMAQGLIPQANANHTFYVSPTGNDATAVPDDASHPYATGQAAVNAAAQYNWNNGGFFPTIQYLDGTYSGAASNINLSPLYGALNSGINFVGHSGDATKVVLTDQFQMSCFPFDVGLGWLTFNCTAGGSGSCINPVNSAVGVIGDLRFTGDAIPIYMEGLSEFLCFSHTITITNSGPFINIFYAGPGVFWFSNATINLPASLTVSDAFLHMAGIIDQSSVGVTKAQFGGITWTNFGGVTGPRLTASHGAYLRTDASTGGEISDLPGSTPGTTDGTVVVENFAGKQGTTFRTITHTLTAADIPQGCWAVIKDSTPARYLAMNDGGTIFKVALT